MNGNRSIKPTFRLLSLLPLLFAAGCWDRVELNDRAFVTAVYLDMEKNGKYELSLGFPLASRLGTGSSKGSSMSGNPFTILTKTGSSIPEAYHQIRSDMSREIAWGHTRVIVIGRKAAEAGIAPLLEFVARQPSFHSKTYVLVSPGKAKEVSGLTPAFERFPSEVLREFAKRHSILDTNVKQFLVARSFGGAMMASMLTLGHTEMLSEKGKISTWVGSDGVALFKDLKLVGTMNQQDMRAAMWVKGQMKKALISIRSPTDGGKMSFSVINESGKIKPVNRQGKISFRIHIKADTTMVSSESNIDVTDPKEVAKLEKALSEQVGGRIKTALSKTQRLGVDAFQFGARVEWRYPQLWSSIREEWPELYRSTDFDLKTEVRIKMSGSEVNPIISGPRE